MPPLECAFALTDATVFTMILWASWPSFVDSWTGSEYFGVHGVFTIPTWPFRLITVVSAATASLAALYCAQAAIRQPGGQAVTTLAIGLVLIGLSAGDADRLRPLCRGFRRHLDHPR